MALRTSNGTGGGASHLGASWAGGVAPVPGDTIAIAAGDTIEVQNGQVLDVGTSAAAGAGVCCMINRPGTLKVAGGGKWIRRGDVNVRGVGAKWDAIWALAGALLEWNSTGAASPLAQHYRLYYGHANDSSSWNVLGRIRYDGTLGNEVQEYSFGVVGGTGAPGYWDLPNMVVGQILALAPTKLTHVIFTDMRNGAGDSFVLSGNVDETDWDHVHGIRCHRLVCTESIPETSTWHHTACTWEQSDVAGGPANDENIRVASWIGGDPATSSFNRTIADSVFDRSIFLNGPDGIIKTGAVFNIGYTISESVWPTTTPLQDVLVVGRGDNITTHAPLKNSVMLHLFDGNPHYAQISPALEHPVTWDGVIFEQLGGVDGDGDIWNQAGGYAGSTPVVHEMVRAIKLPNGRGDSSGCLNVSSNTAGQRKWRMKQCTWHLGAAYNQAPSVWHHGEHSVNSLGLIDETTDNIFWDTWDRGGCIVQRIVPDLVDRVRAAGQHHNWKFHAKADATSEVASVPGISTPGYHGEKYSDVAPGANDRIGDPLFEDATRCWSKWDMTLAPVVNRPVGLSYAAGAVPNFPTKVGFITVLDAAHGRVKGDYVTLGGATQAGYNIEARITDVVDADHYRVGVDVAPSATPATGAPKVVKFGTPEHAISEVKKKNLATYNPAYNIPAFRAYIIAGFVPHEVLTSTTSSTGGQMGAVAYAPGGGGGGPTGVPVFTRQPGGMISGGICVPQPKVESQVAGVTDATDTRTCTLSLVTTAGGPGSPFGTLSAPMVAGVFDPGNVGVTGPGTYEWSATFS